MSAPAPTETGMESRRVAVMLLDAVIERNRPLEVELAESRTFASLSPQDRAFTQRMMKTTLRHKGVIDALLAEWLRKPIQKKQSRIMQLLRIGIAQLLWMELPAHAVLNTSVELARTLGMESQTGLINAILRRCQRESAEALAALDTEKLILPPWLYESWCNAHGEEKARELIRAILQEPAVDISVAKDPEHWAREVGGTLLANGSIRLPESTGPISSLPGFEEGSWWVQDAAASMPVTLLNQIAGGLSGKNVIDLCAAPGGKTAQLIALGANVTAIDISEKRIGLLQENLERLNMSAECIAADASKWSPKEAPDAILLDAPCTATGTIRRHPDVAWHRTPADVEKLSGVQRRLLDHAVSMLKPCGILAYAVCSLQPEEGPAQLEYCRQTHTDTEILRSCTFPPVLSPEDGTGIFRDNTGITDGFFVFFLRKNN